jgi:uncharacterized membrane protein
VIFLGVIDIDATPRHRGPSAALGRAAVGLGAGAGMGEHMDPERSATQDRPVAARVAVAGAVGLVAAAIVGVTAGWLYAGATGWTVAAVLFVTWTALVITPMDPGQTATHATREDPTRPLTDLIVLLASVASLAGVMYLLAAGSGSGADEVLSAGLGIASVAAAWLVVHVVYTLRYALLYYSDHPGGIDFNQSEEPAYVDFAYLAFTLGMTYQVSDTNLQTRRIRTTALRHALLSYVLGAVVLGTVVNLLAGLGSSGR